MAPISSSRTASASTTSSTRLVEANGNERTEARPRRRHPDDHVDGEPNPHFWLDPTLVTGHYLPAIEAKLTEIDPAGAATYRANAAAYAAEIEAMDAELTTDVETIPAANRKLVTFHDAFPYFAAALRLRARRGHPRAAPARSRRPAISPRSSTRSRPPA